MCGVCVYVFICMYSCVFSICVCKYVCIHVYVRIHVYVVSVYVACVYIFQSNVTIKQLSEKDIAVLKGVWSWVTRSPSGWEVLLLGNSERCIIQYWGHTP